MNTCNVRFANSIMHEISDILLIINIVLERKDVSAVATVVLPNILSDISSYKHTIIKGTAPIRARAIPWPRPRVCTTNKGWYDGQAFDNFHRLELLDGVNLWHAPQQLIDFSASSRMHLSVLIIRGGVSLVCRRWWAALGIVGDGGINMVVLIL